MLENYNKAMAEVIKYNTMAEDMRDKIKELTELYLADENANSWAKLKNITEDYNNLLLKNEYLKMNAKYQLYQEVMPIILEILKKYEGKRYGQKCHDNIAEEVRALTNCRFVIDGANYYKVTKLNDKGYENGYIGTLTITPNHYDIKLLTEDNKIKLVNFTDLIVAFDHIEYVQDIDARVKDICAKFENIKAEQEKLESLCREFNDLTPSSIDSIYKDSYLGNKIRINGQW